MQSLRKRTYGVNMTNNDILRRVRYALNLRDKEVIKIFKNVEEDLKKEVLLAWLKKDDEEGYVALRDVDFASFLNGLIIEKRGRREGELPKAEKKLNNNLIFKKLRVALKFRDEDIVDTLLLADFRMSKAEVNALFRNKDHKHFRECKDQVLRNFLHGLRQKLASL